MEKYFAVTSSGKTLRSFFDLRFGQCSYLIFHKPGSDVSKLLENPFKFEDDADRKLAELLKENGITAVITGGVGLTASQLLSENKIQIILLNEEKIKIEDVLARLG